MSKSENKSKTKKILPNHDCRFSNDLFPLKKCCFLHIGNITSNKKNEYQGFNEHSADGLQF